MADFLQGIPIPDDQCIGDSLEPINNAFRKLSASAFNLSATDIELYLLMQSLSARKLPVALSGNVIHSTEDFVIEPENNYDLVLMNSSYGLKVTKNPTATFVPGHKTTFIQVGHGDVSFSGEFNALNNNLQTEGQYAVAAAHFAGNSQGGWVVTGDLRPSQPSLISLTATPEGSYANFVEIVGYPADVIYFYSDPESSSMPIDPPMEIYVNDIFRTKVDAEEDRLGTVFGYTLEDSNVQGPQLSGVFTAGRVDLYTSQGGSNLFNTLNATIDGSEDDLNLIVHYALEEDYVGDLVFYSNDPSPEFETPLYVFISVNGVLRTRIQYQSDRIGTTFGYRRAESFGGAEAMAAFPAEDGETIDFTLGGFRPTPTPTRTPTNTPAPTNTPTRTSTPTGTPVGTPTPTPTTRLYALVAQETPGSEDPVRMISFISEDSSYVDTIFYFDVPIEEYVLSDPMIVYINGERRTSATFPESYVGQQFGYRIPGASSSSQPQVYGTFAPGRVDLFIESQATPTPTPTAATPTPTPTPTVGAVRFSSLKASISGSQDSFNSIGITSTAIENNDTIVYPLTSINDYTTNTMNVYLSGVKRSTITFPAGRVDQQLNYRLAGLLTFTDGGSANVPFTNGTYDLSATDLVVPTLSSLVASDLGGNTDEVNHITFETASSSFFDTIYYYGTDLINYQLVQTPMDVYVQNTFRGTVTFPDDRLGTPFRYKRDGASQIEAVGLFKTGRVDLF